MKRSINRKTKPTRHLMGIKLYIDEMLILLLSYIKWNPIWNRVHSSWLHYSSYYISNLLSGPQDFGTFPNLCILTIVPNQVNIIRISDYKKITCIEIISAVKSAHFINVFIDWLPRLRSLKIQNTKVNYFACKKCDQLTHMILKGCSFIQCEYDSFNQVSDLVQYECFFFGKLFVFPNLKNLETDGYYLNDNMKLNILKTDWIYKQYNNLDIKELHIPDYMIFPTNDKIFTSVTKLYVTKKSGRPDDKIFEGLIHMFPNLLTLILSGFKGDSSPLVNMEIIYQNINDVEKDIKHSP